MATTKITTPELFDLSTVNTALRLPNGSTATRPASASQGEWRFNTDLKYVEFYDGSDWRQIDTESLPFDVSGNFQTSSYVGSNAVNSITSKFDQAGYFNSSLITLPNTLDSSGGLGNNDFSYSFWIKGPMSSTNQIWISLAQNYFIYIGYLSSNIFISLYNDTFSTSVTISDNTWTHIGLAKSNADGILVTKNGASSYTSTTAGAKANLGTSGSGQSNVIGNYSGGSYAFEGALDQIRFYNTPLTEANFNYIYQNETATTASQLNPSGFPSGCIAAYQLDGNANDVSGTYDASSTTSLRYAGTNFTPDFVWTKNINAIASHYLFDSVRGAGYEVYSDLNLAQDPLPSASASTTTLTSFDSKGFSVGTGNGLNNNNSNYVAWQWRAGGAPSATNTQSSGAMTPNSVSLDGVLQSSYTPSASSTLYPDKMSINTEAGLSIINYTGSGSDADIPHGLGSAPGETVLNGFSYQVFLDLPNSASAGSYFLSTNPTANVFTVRGASADVGANNGKYVALCFHSVATFSKVGTYAGSASDVQVDTGFQPTFVLLKNVTAGVPWPMISTAYTQIIYADESSAGSDSSSSYITFNSTGFNLIGNSSSYFTQAGNNFIYLAIA